MRYIFTGKNIVLTDAIKEKVESKLGRLSKLVPEKADVYVTVSVTKLEHKLEVTIPLPKRILRAEVAKDDLYVAIDEIVDVLEKQVIKYKTRLRDKTRKDSSFNEEFNLMFADNLCLDDKVLKIEKTKRFAIKPMDEEEAVMEMELLGHSFFVFRNGSSDEINVVYKRKNGSYGLIEPEF